jgi:DNA-binding NarL/FixJ family response regulator
MHMPDVPLRILLVEDQTIVREALADWIGSNPGWSLAGSVGTLAAARDALGRGDVDLLVLDVRLPDGSGLDLLESIRGPKPAVVVVTAHEQPWLLRSLTRARVLGVVMKGAPLADLRRALELAAEGQPSTCRRTAELLRAWTLRQAPHERLSPREREVLALVAEGLTSRAIAARLGTKEKTVKNQRASAMDKLGVHDVAGLVRYAMDHGLVGPAGG